MTASKKRDVFKGNRSAQRKMALGIPTDSFYGLLVVALPFMRRNFGFRTVIRPVVSKANYYLRAVSACLGARFGLSRWFGLLAKKTELPSFLKTIR
jgi:hypothetical protein